MKELTIEEKAKRFDEALENARYYHDAMEGDVCCVLEECFPQLKESEDEKIRKELIFYLQEEIPQCSIQEHADKMKEFIAWLEKQGEQKPKDKYTFKSIPRLLEMVKPTDRAKAYCQKLVDSLLQEGYDTDAKIVSNCLKQMNGEKVAMATMDEQKPTLPRWKYKNDNTPLLRDSIILNKYGCVAQSPSGALVSDVWVIDYDELAKLPKEEIEKQGNHESVQEVEPTPIFKVGDILKSKLLKGYTFMVDRIQGGYYYNDHTHGSFFPIKNQDRWELVEHELPSVEPKFKIGDIIRFKGNETLKGEVEAHKIVGYDNELYVFADGTTDLFCEQDLYELVEQKSADEVEPKFHEGDIIKPKDGGHEPWQIIQVDISDKKYRFKDGHIIHFSQENDYELIGHNHVWSEEDEKMIERLILSLSRISANTRTDSTSLSYTFYNEINWLKSIKERYTWKPSDEQIEVLESIRKILHADKDIYSKANNLMYNFEELIRTLKKLKEE